MPEDMQRLAGSAAAISRFISRLGEKAVPLYRLLKKSDNFEWTDEADATAELDEETLLYRLRELVQPKHVRTEERVAMGTHDFPPLEVR